MSEMAIVTIIITMAPAVGTRVIAVARVKKLTNIVTAKRKRVVSAWIQSSKVNVKDSVTCLNIKVMGIVMPEITIVGVTTTVETVVEILEKQNSFSIATVKNANVSIRTINHQSVKEAVVLLLTLAMATAMMATIIVVVNMTKGIVVVIPKPKDPNTRTANNANA